MSEMGVQAVGSEPDDGKFLSEEYGAGGPPAAPKRTLDVVEMEIRVIEDQTGQAVLHGAIELGRRLEEAKSMVRHGGWGAWLKKMGRSQSNANDLMRIFREYGSTQQSLFGGDSKSQTFGRLTYSKALKLLSISDEDERERFAIENDVEHMSVRELNEALKARDEAQEAAVAAQEETEKLRKENGQLQEQLDDQARGYEAKLTSAGIEVDQLREKLRGSDLEVVEAKRKAREAQEALDKQRDKAQRLQVALSEANTAAQAAEDKHNRLIQELEELRNRPAEVDTAAAEASRKAAIDEMMEKVNKAKKDAKTAREDRKRVEESLLDVQRKLDALKAKEPEVRELTQEEKDALIADAVEKAKAESAEQIRSLEKKLVAADPDVAEFKVRWNAWREEYREMLKVLERIAQADAERAVGLRRAVKAAWEQMATP